MCVCLVVLFVFFFKQKTAYEMRISDWSSDVCSSDPRRLMQAAEGEIHPRMGNRQDRGRSIGIRKHRIRWYAAASFAALLCLLGLYIYGPFQKNEFRSEEHTSELQSLMRISYAVFCLQ